MEPGCRQLFLDDFVVESMDNLGRTMHQPEKRGAVLRPYFPNGGSLQTRSSPMWIPEERLFNAGVFPYEGVYLALPMIYYPCGLRQPERNNADGFQHIHLTMSRDLVHWTRLGNRRPFIGPSRLDHGFMGVFDRMQLAPFNQPVEREDKLWFYYEGLKWRVPIYDRFTDGSRRLPQTLSPEQMADLREGTSAMCLAVLRRDGFLSLDAGAEGGVILTKPLALAGKRLLLNLDAAQGGSVKVDILDKNGQPIPGFSGNDADAATGNAVRAPVTWRGRTDLAQLKRTVVRLRFRLQNVQFYAFWTE